MESSKTLKSSDVDRRDFLSLSAKFLGSVFVGYAAVGCGPAHKIGKELGLCCDKDRKFRLPSANARFLNNGGAGFNESRLAQMLKDPDYKINDYDPDVIGFVNSVHNRVHGVPIPPYLSVEYADSLGGGLLGRYDYGNLLISKGLNTRESIHTLFHEIGHDYDKVFWSETVAEYEAIRSDLEAIVAFPTLFNETGFGLQRYAFEINFNRASFWKYGIACFESFLSILKNQGDLARAHSDILLNPVSEADSTMLKGLNSLGNYELSHMLKEAAISAWYGLKESSLPDYLKSKAICELSETELPSTSRITLPVGFYYPSNYDWFITKAQECHAK